MPETFRNLTEKPVILFDGVCNLCNGLVRFIMINDAHMMFRMEPLQGEMGQHLIKKYDGNQKDIDSIVFIEEANIYLKSAAVFKIADHLGGFWKAILVFRLLPNKINDYFYDLIAKHRYKLFGQHKKCVIIE